MLTLLFFGSLVVGASCLLGSTLRRARYDWEYRLRLTLVFGQLEWMQSPQFSPDLSEVVIEAPLEVLTGAEVVLLRVQRSSERLRFRLDDLADDRSLLLARWYDAGVPLLLESDDRGAVLHGPGGRLLGQLVPHGLASPYRDESVERQ
jgi:hypothetical protein